MRKTRTCAKCGEFSVMGNLGLCRKFNIEVTINLARKAKACYGFELHHAMPAGLLKTVKKKR